MVPENGNQYRFFANRKLLNSKIDFPQMLSVKLGSNGPSDDTFSFKVEKDPIDEQ